MSIRIGSLLSRVALAHIAAASLLALSGAAVSAENGVSPANGAQTDGALADQAGSVADAVDYSPGFRDFETDEAYSSLRLNHREVADEAFAAVPASARAGKWIEVVLSRQMLYAWENGRVVMSSKISSGVALHPTVRGTFRIYVKYVSTRMRGPGYNLPNVPYTMYFYGGYGIHGAYWHNNFGRPMSHGCVNLPVGFSGQLFRWAPVGTVVYIH